MGCLSCPVLVNQLTILEKKSLLPDIGNLVESCSPIRSVFVMVSKSQHQHLVLIGSGGQHFGLGFCTEALDENFP